ncbi:GNAT family N-acetyltransferase [Adhaeribacter radiodurans]|uniref:GNAT family N-acetyltransferase n=1 Tax=Adhaeribacter radiodurans TaxID=2745197 RepID=A0A7L7LDS1_9BACT|nr:GNAT family N-acetyltransferase [Adhaeribacter radiodurans]QMU30907.1 GNAT family N-acetyltransferase [Adhaeribacter radiodurans]
MEHLLNNPIWFALQSGNKNIASGNAQVKFMQRDIGPFAAMEEYSESNFVYLLEQSKPGDYFILFTHEKIKVPASWTTLVEKTITQMVYLHPSPPSIVADTNLVVLEEKDVPAMLDLTQRTKPGPFLSGTIELGNYIGIFEGSKLIAMAGQRLKPGVYTEISAVCTDPAYTGRGLAQKIVTALVNKILAESRIPMLHLNTDNNSAYNLYTKIGFQTRREIMVYVIQNK